jgi:hypothetical protein
MQEVQEVFQLIRIRTFLQFLQFLHLHMGMNEHEPPSRYSCWGVAAPHGCRSRGCVLWGILH